MPIVKNGLVAYWNAKQGLSGNVWNDLSGNNHALTMSGDYSITAEGMVFGGTNAQGVTSIPETQTAFTIEFMYKPDTRSVTNYLLSVSDNNHNVHLLNTRQIKFSDPTARTIAYILPAATMTHIAMRFVTSVKMDFYVNGVYHSAPSPANFRGIFGNTVYMGSNGATGYIKGVMPFMRLYNRGLSDVELAQNYAMGTNVAMEEPVKVVRSYNGSAWQAVKAKKFDGSQWQEIKVNAFVDNDWLSN